MSRKTRGKTWQHGGRQAAKSRSGPPGRDAAESTRPVVPKVLLGCAIFAITLAAYGPAMRAGYVWDDTAYVPAEAGSTRGRLIRADDGLVQIWTKGTSDYWPLTHTMFWLEWRIWGEEPAGYHVVNVLLHALAAVLLWRLLNRLEVPGAWLAGLIFAVHPLCAASAAWISERKNTLSMVFYLLTILAYLRHERLGRWRWYMLSLIAFSLGLLSKTSIVMLPVVLLGCAWWQRGRIARKDLLRSVPFFALSLAMSLVTIWFQAHRAAGQWEVPPPEAGLARLAAAGWVVWFYLYKALLPVGLCMTYTRWSVEARAVLSWLPLLALFGCFLVVLRYRRRWGRPVLFGLGYFVVTLFPVLGFFDMTFSRYSLVADHFQYVSILGIIALAAGAWGWICKTRGSRIRKLAQAAAAALLVVLSILTWRQAGIYKNHETLWRDTLQKNPKAWVAHNNLAVMREKAGDFDGAIREYSMALELNPNLARTRSNRGNAYQRKGLYEEAIRDLNEAIRLNPKLTNAYLSRGVTYVRKGDYDRAIRDYNKAIELQPRWAVTYHNRAVVYEDRGQWQKAIGDYEKALQLARRAGHSQLAEQILSRLKHCKAMQVQRSQ